MHVQTGTLTDMFPVPDVPHGQARVGMRRATSASAPTKRWPAWSWLEDRDGVMFLDVETTGLSRYYDALTIVGYQLAGESHVLVAGEDPAHLFAALAMAKCLVTFNGTLFDLPFLRAAYPGLEIRCPHLDLRYTARRVGLLGGQKAIERELASRVRDGLEDLDGRAAVLLWHRYLRGERQAMRDLIGYNLADVSGMRDILDAVCLRMREAEQADLFDATSTFAGAPLSLVGLSDPNAPIPSPTRPASRSFADVFADASAARLPVVGIDLTGSEARPSGFCVLEGPVARTSMLASDDELIAAVMESGARVVSIDSPLSLPRGRTRVTDDDPGRREFGIMRACERTLKRRGVNVYPCLLPSMQRLTARGILLAERLRKAGFAVIESYPGAAQDIMGIPRKGAGLELLARGLADFGLDGEFVGGKVRHDELDAITSALVGYFFLAGRYEALGGEGESAMIVPDVSRDGCRRLVVGLSGRIGAGKTTAARRLERRGFAYARFSQAVDAVICADGVKPDRASRQAYGWRLHEAKGQAWLLDRLLEVVGDAEAIVVDGLRFPEDHANLVERFGGGFMHVHVNAGPRTRAARLGMDPDFSAWHAMEAAPTEAHADALARLGDVTISNEEDLVAFENAVDAALLGAERGERECQSAS